MKVDGLRTTLLNGPSTLDLIIESDRWYEDLILRVVMLVVHGTGTNIPVLVAMSRPIFTASVGS